MSHRLSLRGIVLAAVMALTVPLAAQPGVFRSQSQPLAVLPDPSQGLSIVGGNLYAASADVLLLAQRHQGDIMGFVVDTEYVKLDDAVTYVVKRPYAPEVYYTARDRKGHSRLYVSYRDGKRTKTRRIKLDDIEVLHPTFSADGQVLVFASSEKRRSYGGLDLWYSRFVGDEWTRPVNMGDRVNSQGDEVSPCVVGDFLFFSSNGRRESNGHLNIFTTRLIANQVVGDTVGMLQIGRSRVQHLPSNINSAVSDCYDFVVDTALRCCYWYNASSGIRSYNGLLDAMMLWGYLYDTSARPLAGVTVTAYDADDPVAAALSGTDGFYRICLPAGRSYRLHYTLPNHFHHSVTLRAERDNAGNLIGEAQRDVTLAALPIGQPIVYTDLFGPDAVVDLSRHGIDALEPLVDFLNDNPTLQAELTLSCDLTADPGFNSILTDQRLLTLKAFLDERLPADVRYELRNGCAGREGCSTATGTNRLTVLLR